MSTLAVCWHTLLIVGFVVGEIWLIVKIASAIRKRREPLPPVVREISHGIRNDAAAIHATLQLHPDPIGALLKTTPRPNGHAKGD